MFAFVLSIHVFYYFEKKIGKEKQNKEKKLKVENIFVIMKCVNDYQFTK